MVPLQTNVAESETLFITQTLSPYGRHCMGWGEKKTKHWQPHKLETSAAQFPVRRMWSD